MTEPTILGQKYHDALIRAANAKNEALAAERLKKRVYAQCFLQVEGKNAAEREAKSITHAEYQRFEEQWIEAETRANLAKAEAEALAVKFEAWRTDQATRRAEMQIR